MNYKNIRKQSQKSYKPNNKNQIKQTASKYIFQELEMNHSHYHQKHTKRFKTEIIGYSAFDDSIVHLILSKIQKCLYNINRNKFDTLSANLKLLNRDISVLSEQCKDKKKISILMTHITIFEMIHNKNYDSALDLINRKIHHFSQKTDQILKLSSQLLKSLILKFLNKQEESKQTITKAIQQINLKQFRVQTKTTDEKIVECGIICVSIIADRFSEFEFQSLDFREIYKQAYKIAYKYLTQYHKLTETLYTICQKFPSFNPSSIKRSKNKYILHNRKKNSLAEKSNRTFINQIKSDRSYLNFSLKSQILSEPIENLKLSDDCKNIAQISKRYKTIESHISSQLQYKQKSLNKLYGTDISEESIQLKKAFKRGKLSSSVRNSPFQPQFAVQMKQLQKISKIYLPKLQAKRKNMFDKKKQKLNAVQVLKFGSTLARLKPNYFEKLKTQQSEQGKTFKAPQQTIQISKRNSHIEATNMQKALKEELSPQKQQQQKIQRIPLHSKQQQFVPVEKSQQNCQLI